MRLILIPGFGEDETIFDKIHDKLPGEKLVLSFWQLLPNVSVKSLNTGLFAMELIERFQINKTDLIIGHSAGGWVALHIKNVVGCGIVQIASWTDESKVIAPVRNWQIIYLLAKTGLLLNSFMMQRTVKKYYQGKPSKEIFLAIFNKLANGNRENVLNQLRLVFKPSPGKLSVKSDLVIHARGDKIIRFPDGPVHEVAGDHFSLYTYPEQVYPPIVDFIKHYTKE